MASFLARTHTDQMHIEMNESIKNENVKRISFIRESLVQLSLSPNHGSRVVASSSVILKKKKSGVAGS